MDEILKIIIKNNKARKILSVDDVKKICHIIIKRNKYDFVKHVNFTEKHPDDEKCGGTFCGDRIIFFYKGLMDILTNYADNFTDTYNIDGSTVDVVNFYYLVIIFHELAHARQHYLVESKKNSTEKKIFSFFHEIEIDRDFYEANYSNLLTEVNAVNVSNMTATYFYNKMPINFVSPQDKNIYQAAMMSALLYSNYTIDPRKEIVVGPAERVAKAFTPDMFDITNMDMKQYADIVLDNKLTLYKKIMLGFPISYIEYAYARLVTETLSSEDNINVCKKLQKKFYE